MATFRIKSAFQLTGRQFFILGDILSGSIRKGMYANLKQIGINKSLIIEVIEFALHRKENKSWEDTCLGFSDLSETEKEFLKSNSPFSTPITIEEENTD